MTERSRIKTGFVETAIAASSGSGLLLALLAIAGTANAASVDRFRTDSPAYQRYLDTIDTLFPEEPLVEGLQTTVGIGAGYAPAYQGARDYKFTVIPILRVSYKDYLSLTGGTLKANAISSRNFTAGVLVKYLPGRNRKEDGPLAGLDGVKDTVAIGPFVEYRKGAMQVTVEWRHALGAGQGNVLKLTIASGLYQSKDGKFAVQGAVSSEIGNAKHLRSTFGVTAREAALSKSGFKAYRPGGGLYDIAFSLGARYKLTDRWGVGQFVELDRLIGPADESPLVKQGMPWMITGGLGTYYKF